MSIRKTFETSKQTQLDAWKDRLEKLREKAEQEETNLQLEYYTLIEEIDLKIDDAHKKLHLLKQAGDEKWEELKMEIETTWDSLEELIKSLTLP
jgi:hypothetical protein